MRGDYLVFWTVALTAVLTAMAMLIREIRRLAVTITGAVQELKERRR